MKRENVHYSLMTIKKQITIGLIEGQSPMQSGQTSEIGMYSYWS